MGRAPGEIVRAAWREGRTLLLGLPPLLAVTLLLAEFVRDRSDNDYADVVQACAFSVGVLFGAFELLSAVRTGRHRLLAEQLASFHAMQGRLADDLKLAALVHKAAHRPKELTDAEVTQVFSLIAMRLTHFESMYLQSGGPAEAVLEEAWTKAIFTYFTPEVVHAYWEIDKHTYDHRFQAAIKARLDDPPTGCAVVQFGDALRPGTRNRHGTLQSESGP